MERVLRLLAHKSPGTLLAYAWVALILLSPLAYLSVSSGFAAGAGALIFVGYPYFVSLGLPVHIVRSRVRGTAKLLFGALLVAAVIGVVAIPFLDEAAEGAPISSLAGAGIMAAVIIVNIVIFAPFFLATAALNDLRKSVGVQPAYDSVPNFVALYFWLFGGVFYVHRQVQAALMPANKSLERTRER
jgi:hypothetical protein